MIYEVSHRTLYRYSAAVVQSQHLVHMSPRPVQDQVVHHHSLLIEPAPTLRADLADYFGNPIVMLDIEREHTELMLHARSTVDVTKPSTGGFAQSPNWESVAAAMRQLVAPPLDIVQFASPTQLTYPTRAMADYGLRAFGKNRPILDGARELSAQIFADFKFDTTATDLSTPLAEVFEKRRGVCQDFAHLALACLRGLGLPARYVSGYLLTRQPPGQPKLQGADASHAWISVWCPANGWVDLDPTNNVLARQEHITFAWGRDYDDISPISGVILGGGEHTVAIGVDVVAAGEPPR